jgi:phage terminase small subunit
MPILSNARHERFAQLVAKGKSIGLAYVSAGYRPHAANPTRLRARREIDERIGEIEATQQLVQEKAEERAIDAVSITRAGVLRMLIEDHDVAREKGQIGAAVRATELLGKELGMFVERRELRIEDRLAAMTKEQREAHAEQLAAQIRETVDRYKLIEGETVDVTPADEADC